MNDDLRMSDTQAGCRGATGLGRWISAVAVAATLLVPDWTAHAADGKAVLHWKSGDSLPGRLVRIDADEVVWECGLFAAPLQLQRLVLSTVSFEPSEVPSATSDEFRIVLQSGDVLFGSLHALDHQTLTVASVRHGDVRIPRQLIAGIERINHDGLIYLGPAGREGWSGENIKKNWREETDGSLTSSTADARLTRRLRSENKIAIEFILSFRRLPEFVLALGSDDEDGLRIETWDDALVVCNQDEFVEIQLLHKDTAGIHLLLYVDMQAKRALVCSPRGEVLAELPKLTPKRAVRAFSLRNGSGQLTLQHLRVERWNGTTVGSLVSGRTGVQKVDGNVSYGVVESIKDGLVTLRGDTGGMTIPVKDLGSLEVSAAEAEHEPESTENSTRIKWRDGGLLYGNLIGITESAATVETHWSKTPVSANPDGIQLIEFSDETTDVEGPDELIVGGRLLHGHLVVDAGNQPVTWKPTGAAVGVALQSSDNAVVRRSTEATAVWVDPKEYPDTIYLRNNDVIPCRLEGMTDDAVRLTSPFSSAKEFSSADIKALELLSTRQQNSAGFDDQNWMRVRGRVKKDAGAVKLISGSFGHSNGMVSDRLSFQVRWPGDRWTSMTVHLFAENLRRPATSSTCAFMFSANNVIVTHKFDTRNPFAAVQNPESRIQTKGPTAEIQLVTSRGKLEVVVDGKTVQQFPLERAGAGKSGVLFELSQSGNGRFFAGRRHIEVEGSGKVTHLTLSNLQTGSPSGTSVQRFIDDETRQITLTIPRFRRDAPPTHVLIAPNGDVLRGRLIAIHSDSVEFESRLEVFRFPRERVATIVWIKNPDRNRDAGDPVEEIEVDSASSTVLQTVLNGGFLVSMTPARLSNGLLYGDSPVLGRCSVPAATISRLYLGDPEQRNSTAAYSQWRARHGLEPDWDIAKSDGGNADGSELIGQAAADFELPQVDGETFRLSEHAGKIIVLDFWATWCRPCVAALPDYVEATRHFHESELVFVAVNIEESPQQIRAFLKEHQLDMRVAIDGGSEVALQYQVGGIPHSLIISPEGTIEYVHVGYDPDAGSEIQRVAEAILSGNWSRDTSAVQESNTSPE